VGEGSPENEKLLRLDFSVIRIFILAADAERRAAEPSGQKTT